MSRFRDAAAGNDPSPNCRSKPLRAGVLEHADEFLASVAVAPGEADEFLHMRCDGCMRGCADHGDTSSAAEFKQSFVAKITQRTEHGVGVDSKHERQVAGWWKPLAGLGFAIGDCSADLAGDLLMELGGFGSINLDT